MYSAYMCVGMPQVLFYAIQVEVVLHPWEGVNCWPLCVQGISLFDSFYASLMLSMHGWTIPTCLLVFVKLFPSPNNTMIG